MLVVTFLQQIQRRTSRSFRNLADETPALSPKDPPLVRPTAAACKSCSPQRWEQATQLLSLMLSYHLVLRPLPGFTEDRKGHLKNLEHVGQQTGWVHQLSVIISL